MYKAVGHQVFVHGELFITIHPTNTTVSVEEQAKIVATMLNEMGKELKEDTLIIVDDGDTFEGYMSHWRDCFFSNPCRENIESFCKEMGWRVEFKYV